MTGTSDAERFSPGAPVGQEFAIAGERKNRLAMEGSERRRVDARPGQGRALDCKGMQSGDATGPAAEEPEAAALVETAEVAGPMPNAAILTQLRSGVVSGIEIALVDMSAGDKNFLVLEAERYFRYRLAGEQPLAGLHRSVVVRPDLARCHMGDGLGFGRAIDGENLGRRGPSGQTAQQAREDRTAAGEDRLESRGRVSLDQSRCDGRRYQKPADTIAPHLADQPRGVGVSRLAEGGIGQHGRQPECQGRQDKGRKPNEIGAGVSLGREQPGNRGLLGGEKAD